MGALLVRKATENVGNVRMQHAPAAARQRCLDRALARALLPWKATGDSPHQRRPHVPALVLRGGMLEAP